MVCREKYLAEIRGFYRDDLIKIITGVRRCGKSIVLEQIREELSESTDNYVFLDFDVLCNSRKVSEPAGISSDCVFQTKSPQAREF